MSAACHREGAELPPEPTVFVSGSRSIAHLDEPVRHRLANMIARRLRIVVGDAPGADAAFQRHLARAGYGEVAVFCAGAHCRNNAGAWKVTRIRAGQSVRGRDFYTVKDKAMAREADYGFVVWDGRSAGSLANIRELLALRKPVLVYLVPEKRFFTLRQPTDLAALPRR
jgi:hypothetical protein